MHAGLYRTSQGGFVNPPQVWKPAPLKGIKSHGQRPSDPQEPSDPFIRRKETDPTAFLARRCVENHQFPKPGTIDLFQLSHVDQDSCSGTPCDQRRRLTAERTELRTKRQAPAQTDPRWIRLAVDRPSERPLLLDRVFQPESLDQAQKVVRVQAKDLRGSLVIAALLIGAQDALAFRVGDRRVEGSQFSAPSLGEDTALDLIRE